MSLIVKNDGGGDFELAPAGNHVARCYSVVDLGYQEVTWQGVIKHQRKVRISWELSFEKMQDGRPFSITRNYTMSLSEKSNLYKDLVSWRGRPFTEKELEGFDLFNILGAPAMVNVVHNTSEGKSYANVAGIGPLPKGMTAPDLVNDIVRFSIADSTPAEYQALPDWLQKKINMELVDEPATIGQRQDGQDFLEQAFPDDDIPF